jgi:hypothetical protein
MNNYMKMLSLAAIALLTLAMSCNKGADASKGVANVSQAPTAGSAAQVKNAGGAPAGADICGECGKPEAECSCEGHGAPPAGGAGGAAAAATLTSDGIRIVDATAVDVDPNPYVGRVAINGKVGDVWAEKGTFTLVDLKQMPGCTDGCCPKTNIPVSVSLAEYSGDFPKAGEVVLVICELSTTDTGGYSVQVEEVRQGEKTLIKRAKPA